MASLHFGNLFHLKLLSLTLLLPPSLCQDNTFHHISISISSPSDAFGDRVLPEYERFDDMILPRNFFHPDRNAVPYQQLLWPRGMVPYVIDVSMVPQTNLIMQAMKQFHTRTCIRFIPRTNENNYLNIFSGGGCYSYVGHLGRGEQPLSLGGGCHYLGTVVHELNHAVGFYHEHNRSDRDNYINIYWQNIQRGFESQFQKLTPEQNKLITAFDYESIMIYGEYAFSRDKGRDKTMEDKYRVHKLLEPYDKKGLTASDVERINKLYGCRV